MQEEENKFYQKWWFIVLMLFLFFPIGLYLMWKHEAFNKTVRWVVTGVFASILLPSMFQTGDISKATGINFLIVIALIISIAVVIKVRNENEKLIDIKEKYKDIIDLDEEGNRLTEEVMVNREKALKLSKIKANLEKEISILEEVEVLQEYGFYKVKHNLDSSEAYKDRMEEVKGLQKSMLKDGSAAYCNTDWHVGNSKKKGEAMTKDNLKIMLRAFNGECDGAIAKVKYNNIETMRKRINKSFDMINKLNKRNDCHLSNLYLDYKIIELELTHEYHEKVQEEKEEQRRIKEQIREEERAQKEYERAIMQAQKDEESAKKALEKAREQLSQAHGEKVEKLKQQMQALEEKLKEVEEKNQRATSMAQMTKSGYVYIISNIGSFGEDVYKIGMTRRLEPLDRVRELSGASVPFKFDVHAMIYTDNAPELENSLHKVFDEKRVNRANYRKEFFNVSLDKIKEEVEKIHGEFRLTKLAEAREYRESLIRSEKKDDKSEIIDNVKNLEEEILAI